MTFLTISPSRAQTESAVRAKIDANLPTNGSRAITALRLREVLKSQTDYAAKIDSLAHTRASSAAVTAGLAVKADTSITGNLSRTRTPMVTSTQLREWSELMSGNAPPAAILTDKQGAVFYYDATDTTTPDDSVMTVRFGSKRYKRPYENGVYVDWFGAVGDGVTDDTQAFQKAINWCGEKIPLKTSPNKSYLITKRLDLPDAFALYGSRIEKGTTPARDGYNTSTIIFRPSNGTDWLINEYSTVAPFTSTIGPYVIHNLKLDFGDYNGIKFGDEVIGVSEGSGQRYVFGVSLLGNSYVSSYANRNSSSTGVITRSGKIQVHLTKCFECKISESSFLGSDVQIRLFGNDNPSIENIRSQGAHMPIEVVGSGTFQVTGNITNAQIENWTFTPILLKDHAMSVIRGRFEQNDFNPTGSRRLNLSGLASPITAAITAGSGTITMSRSVDNIIFPYLSLLEISDGTNTDVIVPISVSGTTVTYSTTTTALTWSDTDATVTRIHSYGPIAFGTQRTKSFVSCDFTVGDNTPSLVMGDNLGTMSVVSCYNTAGVSNSQSLVIPNRAYGSYYMSSVMSFSGCDNRIIADPNHPFVHVDNWHGRLGEGYDNGGFRGYSSSISEEITTVLTRWAFTPKGRIGNASDAMAIPVKQVAGQANTSQKYWCWYVAGGSTLRLYENTLTTTANRWLKITIRARMATDTAGTMRYVVIGATGHGSPYFALTNQMQSFTFYAQTEGAWANPNSTIAGFHLESEDSKAILVAGMLVEDAQVVPGQTQLRLSAAPTVGTFAVGDRVINTAPAETGTTPNKYIIQGWTCTVAGTPGTWVQNRTYTGN